MSWLRVRIWVLHMNKEINGDGGRMKEGGKQGGRRGRGRERVRRRKRNVRGRKRLRMGN